MKIWLELFVTVSICWLLLFELWGLLYYRDKVVPYEIIWNANLMHGADVAVHRTAPSAPHTRPTQQLSSPPPTQKLGAENRMLQLNVWCSWWCAYVPEICRAKNTLIKLPCCITLAFQIISWGRCTVKQPSSRAILREVITPSVRALHFQSSLRQICDESTAPATSSCPTSSSCPLSVSYHQRPLSKFAVGKNVHFKFL